MTEFTNGYFQMMYDIFRGYGNAKEARKAERESMLKANDWDGLKAWKKREENFPFPFTSGYMKAFWAWQKATEKQSYIENHVDALEVSDLPWDKDAHDFITCLREAGVSEIAITDQSTALMRLLHIFEDEKDCRLYGLCKVTRSENQWGVEGTVEYNGILMQI